MNRSLRNRLTIVVASTFAALAVSTPASAGTAGTLANGYVINRVSALCLTIAGGSTANLAPAVQYPCDGHPSRQWQFANVFGAYQLINENSGRCLTLDGGSTANNAPVVQYTCDTHPARLWVQIIDSDGYFQLRNVNSGKCLTIAGASVDNNAPAVQYTCDFHAARDWY